MMANPEMSSTQEQGLAAVPPQGRPADAAVAPETAQIAQTAQAAEIAQTAQIASAPAPDAPRRRSAPDQDSAPARSYEPDAERMPLMARVLLGDLAVAVVGLVLLFVIEVQRFGDASFHLRREAWGEDLVVLFGVGLVFGVITFLLVRARHMRVAIVQTVVTALVLAAAITSAATGDPKPTPDTTTTVSNTGNPG